jgi:hypothetical protein
VRTRATTASLALSHRTVKGTPPVPQPARRPGRSAARPPGPIAQLINWFCKGCAGEGTSWHGSATESRFREGEAPAEPGVATPNGGSPGGSPSQVLPQVRGLPNHAHRLEGAVRRAGSLLRHARAGGHPRTRPAGRTWTPAFAGVTKRGGGDGRAPASWPPALEGSHPFSSGRGQEPSTFTISVCSCSASRADLRLVSSA